LINGTKIKPSYLVKFNDKVSVDFIEIESKKEVVGEKIDLNIIYEDDNVIVVNKQPNLVVHPASGNWTGTLVNALINHFPEIEKAVYDKDSQVSKLRPGLVHRLDKDTSGAIIVAKNARTMASLSKQIQNRTVKKTYLGLCYGWPKDISKTLINYLGRHPKNRKYIADIGQEKGKEAILDYNVIRFLTNKKGDRISLIEFDLKTGRTHQIRVQASMIGHPVLGDNFYGNKLSDKLSERYRAERQLLHSLKLSITLPGNLKPSVFSAPVPKDFKKVMEQFSETKI
jgi:23S rRNA pseudouridine1911/1915/1917 synthase